MFTTLITGANRGIGLELSRAYARKGSVIAVCRTSSSELDALDVRVEHGIDLTSEADVASLARRLEKDQLDVLVSNAGILGADSLDDLRLDDVRQQIEVNAIGPLRLVLALRNRLERGGKIGLITSRMGSIEDNTSGGYYGYRMSKAALNIMGVSLAHDLRPLGISVAILHPGYVRTDMTDHHGSVEPSEAARQLIERMDALTTDTSGTFWHANGTVLPW